MADLPETSASISCEACGFENPTTSLYCQDCGARLVVPQSAATEAAPPQPDSGFTPAPKPSARARILTVNRPRHVRTFIIITIRALVAAAIIAPIVLILRPPFSIPAEDPALPDDVVNNVRDLLSTSAQTGKTVPASWAPKGLNAYLATVLRPGASGIMGTSFECALVAPAGDDSFTLVVKRKMAGLTLYSSVTYRIVPRGNGISLAPVAASLGRLPLPAATAPAVLAMSGGLDQALSPELDLLGVARNVRITPDEVYVDFGPPHP